MDKVTVRLNVFFSDPFWVGVMERVIDGKLTVCRITFGAEPKEHEVGEFLMKHYFHLRFSPAVAADAEKIHKNPKRVRREARRHLDEAGVGTKSQQALKLQQEQGKTAGKLKSREEKEAQKQRQFEQKQQKRKEKHRGR